MAPCLWFWGGCILHALGASQDLQSFSTRLESRFADFYLLAKDAALWGARFI